MSNPILLFSAFALASLVGYSAGRGWNPSPAATMLPTAPPSAASMIPSKNLDAVSPDTEAKIAMKAGKDLAEDSAARQALRQWALDSFDDAWTFVMALPNNDESDKRQRNQALAVILAALASNNAEAAWKHLYEAATDTGELELLKMAFIKEWAQADFSAALRFVDGNPSIPDWRAAANLLSDPDARTPWAYLHSLTQVRDPELLRPLLRRIAQNWSVEDLRGFIQYNESLAAQAPLPSDTYFPSEMIAHALRGNPTDCFAMLESIRSDQLRSAAWQTVARQLLQEPGQARLKEGLTSPYAKALLSGLASAGSMHLTTSEETMALIDRLPEGAEKVAIVTAIAKDAAEVFDIQRAQSLLNRLPDDAGSEVFASLGSAWQSSDPTGAQAWLESLPPGSTERDWAAAGIASAHHFTTLDEASQWVTSIRNVEAQKAAIEAVGEYRFAFAEAEWIQWLRQFSNLTPVEFAELSE